MSFLYFIPHASIGGKQAVEPADFKSLGLSHALMGDVGIQYTPTTGPEQTPGLLCSLAEPDAPKLVYQPDQTWRKGPDGKFFVGMPPLKPGPAQLHRQKLYGGQEVRLLDGNQWIIPRCVAVLPGSESSLPYMIELAEDGKTITSSVHPSFASISRRAFDFWLFFRGDHKQITIGWLTDLAIDALSVNYRIGKVEVLGLLKLISEEERNLILRAMIGADEIERWAAENAEKKDASAPSELPMTSGAAA